MGTIKGMISSTSGSSSRCAGSTVFKLCQQAEKHFPVFTDDTRKILAVGDLKKEEVRRGRSEPRPERRLSWLRVCSGVQAQVCGSCIRDSDAS